MCFEKRAVAHGIASLVVKLGSARQLELAAYCSRLAGSVCVCDSLSVPKVCCTAPHHASKTRLF
jgi:hypothetical protein